MLAWGVLSEFHIKKHAALLYRVFHDEKHWSIYKKVLIESFENLDILHNINDVSTNSTKIC